MSLMIHGVESDWIEEEMADDDDFRYLNNIFVLEFNAVIRKDVLEQKAKKALEEIGFSKKVAYKVGFVDFSLKSHNPFLAPSGAQGVTLSVWPSGIKCYQGPLNLHLSQASIRSL